jgi:hypothetical protein
MLLAVVILTGFRRPVFNLKTLVVLGCDASFDVVGVFFVVCGRFN